MTGKKVGGAKGFSCTGPRRSQIRCARSHSSQLVAGESTYTTKQCFNASMPSFHSRSIHPRNVNSDLIQGQGVTPPLCVLATRPLCSGSSSLRVLARHRYGSSSLLDTLAKPLVRHNVCVKFLTNGKSCPFAKMAFLQVVYEFKAALFQKTT